MTPTTHEITVTAEQASERLDVLVGGALGLSRAKVKKLFEDGAVRVNGRLAKKGVSVVAGDRIAVTVEPEGEPLVAEPAAPLSILHEDAALLFIDKPSGMPSHPLKPGETGTVANALAGRYPEVATASEDAREGGLCHRLDVETSGVLLAARTRDAWTRMREAFTRRDVDKRYWALVTGPIGDDGEIDLPLRHHHDRVQAAADAGPDAREALSEFHVLARSGEASLVEVRIHTGVLHQVRAHLAAIGASIWGDTHYGGRADPDFGRFFLHARSLALEHPVTHQRLTVTSALPKALADKLSELGFDAAAYR